MYNITFQNLPEKQPDKPAIGDMYLEGKLVDQKQTKVKGNPITYYVITDIIPTDYGKNIVFQPVYDFLED
jgi:hypothetical protein